MLEINAWMCFSLFMTFVRAPYSLVFSNVEYFDGFLCFVLSTIVVAEINTVLYFLPGYLCVLENRILMDSIFCFSKKSKVAEIFTVLLLKKLREIYTVLFLIWVSLCSGNSHSQV